MNSFFTNMESVISELKHWQSTAKTHIARIAFKTQYYSKKFLYNAHLRLPHFKKAHVNTYPAVHFKKFDNLDYCMKFSSELMVFAMTLVVAAFNLYFFHGSEYTDKSYAAKFLEYHHALNNKLYARQAAVKTTVVNSGNLIASAYADNFGLTSEESSDDLSYEDSQSFVVNDNTLVAPSPDSVAGLIAKQIKIYETKEGDTLKSIGEANGISPQTISWANKLTSPTIKPGWQLIILPTDGILHKASRNDTLPDIAKKYKANLDTIIAYNGLENAEDIDEGQLIIVPGGTITPQATPEKPTKPTKKPNDGKVNPGKNNETESVPKTYIDDGSEHTFPKGYCTWYVAQRVRVPWGGNAKNWIANAKAYGAIITKTPAVGTIVVTNDNARYGHVAYVESVDDDGFTVSEMNYKAFGKTNTRWISKNSSTIRGFIHP